ncbi:hypothetical protein [Streptomyces sp. NBC_00568]|uniref:hypothetical protein n=1 Tax=Streptomyces sp. NBC_00568 TaxID=2975779 RepID=UPI00224EE890|nr:hypothetical protein [Streptomyces sp. NBC_00568]MCX4993661.1 hypothetical protein [Streptomyces sp. NBC_00568]
MFEDVPIYRRLVAERGDIPAQVRGEAERIRKDLQQVMRPRQDSYPTARRAGEPAGPAVLPPR